MDSVKCTTLIDSGAQMSTITISFTKQLDLPKHNLNRILNIEATHEGKVPYLGYVETHLQVHGIKAFDEDVLMLILKDSPYGQGVPIQVGILHLHRIINHINKDKINALTCKWQ